MVALRARKDSVSIRGATIYHGLSKASECKSDFKGDGEVRTVQTESRLTYVEGPSYRVM